MKTNYKHFLPIIFVLSITNIFASTPKPSFKGVEFKASTNVLCTTGQSVTYKNTTDEKKLDGEFSSSYVWTFEGGTPSSYKGETPPAINYNIVGVFKTTLVGTALNSKGEVLGKREYVETISVENPKINLGMDKTLCANSVTTLDAGPGFKKHRWTPENNNGKLGDEQQLVVSKSGVYRITAETENGCEASDMIKISFEVCTGVSSSDINTNLKAYPNPAKDVLNFEANFSNSSELNVVLTNSQGQEVSKISYSNIISINDQIDISSMVPGIYRANYYVNGVLAKSTNILIQ